MKLIEAKAVDNLLYEELPMKYFYGRSLNTAVKNQAAIRERVAQIPAVDAVPVAHGRWIDKGLDLVCSACGIRYSDELPYMSRLSTPGSWDMEGFEYCPHCGAKMDGERVSE